ncbi:hypothetical protein Unana1_05894 [Umbelopsis nana]
MTAAPPWIKESAGIDDPEDRLAKEVEEFAAYIAPSQKENRLREEALRAVSEAIMDIWPDSTVEVYGSFVTGLELPSSDVDISVKTAVELPPNAIPNMLRQLRKVMMQRQLTTFSRTNLVARPGVKVPVFAFSLMNSDIEVDVCINNDAPSTPMTIQWLKEYPLLKPLFLALKHGLSSLHVDEYPTFCIMDSKRNGVASYSLICLIVRYLQMEQGKKQKGDKLSLDKHLLQFLKFWSEFDFVKTGIYLKNGGGFFQKKGKSERSKMNDDGVICIEDPDMDGNNVARASSKIDIIKSGLQKASKLLHDRVSSSDAGSILATFIILPNEIDGQRPCGKKYLLEGLGYSKDRKYAPSRNMIKDALSKSYGKRKRDHEKDYHSRSGWKGSSDSRGNDHYGKRKRGPDTHDKSYGKSTKYHSSSSHQHKRRS